MIPGGVPVPAFARIAPLLAFAFCSCSAMQAPAPPSCPEPPAIHSPPPVDSPQPPLASASASPSPAQAPSPENTASPAAASDSDAPLVVLDFRPDPFRDDDTRRSAYEALPGSTVYDSPPPGERVKCGDKTAFVVDKPLVAGGPHSGSIVVGTAQGRTLAVIPPSKATWRLFACADLTGDRSPELIVCSFSEQSMILTLGGKVAPIYQGSLPFPERSQGDKVVLHVRDHRLVKLSLAVPGVLMPTVPTYWAWDGTRIADQTRQHKERVEAQRAEARKVIDACLAEKEATCVDRAAAFYAGTAVLLGDETSLEATLPKVLRGRFRELVSRIGKGASR